MADGTNTGVREQGQGKTELRISLGGTHTRRDDLEALHTWLANASVLEGALERGELTLKREDSLTQTETMSGELIQDIILVVSVEVARSVSENAWRSVETWLRNRRRFADPEETPRVTLDGPAQGPGSDLSRDTDTDPGVGPDTGRAAGPDAGPPEPGGRNPTRGGDEPGEV
ncbi:hypothetical protein [Streptomyces sp. HB132]|uniref:hypothetical protein n=1 Tax=Streptomyces sp. HB132 TaxID=767388 RepID=UPI001DE4D6BE|nr:hypothetical protein [Streptomyces sp. HB132]MBM7438935.1 hypothetical protein [Streptomyces sp. HB132]